ILGVGTFAWSFVLIIMLPNTIRSAKFLDEREKRCCEQRVIISGTGKTNNRFVWKQAIECLMDVKTFGYFSISLLTQIPNSGVQNFGNLVLKGFGFTSLQTTLVITPASVITFLTIMGTGYLSGHHKNIATYIIVVLMAFPVAGSAIIYANPSKGVKLFAYYLLSTGPAVLPLVLSLVGVNYKGSTKKMTMTAIMFLAYCAGNIAGPHFFKSNDAPHYPTAFRAILVCYSLAMVIAVLLRFYVMWQNRRRDRVEGQSDRTGDYVRDKAATKVNSQEVPVDDGLSDGEDLTDLQTPGFRYRM
ncbi:hypothetical protein KEM55_008084, partial [Ascosphaera atra]